MSDGISDGNRKPDILDVLEGWPCKDDPWARQAADEIKRLRAWYSGSLNKIAALEKQLQELKSGKVWVVKITYRDGQVMRTVPLTQNHANEHCDQLIRISTVVRAEVVAATQEDIKLAGRFSNG